MPDEGVSLFGRNRMLPANIGAEQAVLGALLANNKAFDRVSDLLLQEHFADSVNGRIYLSISNRIVAGQVADPVTLMNEFQNAGILDDVGGTAYLAQLTTAMVGIMNARDYAMAIYDTWLRRALIEVCDRTADAAYGDGTAIDANAMVDSAAEAVLALGVHSSTGRGTDFATVAAGAPRRAEQAYQGVAGHRRLDTGIASIDNLWGGLWPGELYYLMARSRTGKTPLMMQIARNVAGQLAEKEPGDHVHVFSLEMTADGVMTTSLASTTKYSADQIKSGHVDYHLLGLASEALGRLPIVLDDQADMDLPALVMRALATKRQRKTRLICIDYRELVRRGKEQSKMSLPEWIPYLGYALKALAKRCNVPVIALAQINKTKSGDAPVRPTLDDLPYDGGQAADGVFALHRPELYMPRECPHLNAKMKDEARVTALADWDAELAKFAGVTEFIALKRRFGPTGYPCKLRFDGPRMLIREWDDNWSTEEAALDFTGDGGR